MADDLRYRLTIALGKSIMFNSHFEWIERSANCDGTEWKAGPGTRIGLPAIVDDVLAVLDEYSEPH